MPMKSLMALVTELVSHVESGTLDVGFHRTVRRGSAHGSVTVEIDPGDHSQLLIIVRMEICRAPRRNLQVFLATLLELNHGFQGRAAFSLDDLGVVYLNAGRPVANLDEDEVVDLILWTSEQADHWDDILMDSFP
jgi:hypothetical protein